MRYLREGAGTPAGPIELSPIEEALHPHEVEPVLLNANTIRIQGSLHQETWTVIGLDENLWPSLPAQLHIEVDLHSGAEAAETGTTRKEQEEAT